MEKKKIIVLGAGLVGNAIAIDLNEQYDVTAVDNDQEALDKLSREHNIKIITKDLSKGDSIKAAVDEFDLVIGALPGFMGFDAVKQVIRAGKNMVDISFFSQDPFILDEAARRSNVTVVVDCGIAPGMGNIILGYHNHHMNIDRYECLVGGLPFEREWPFEYKAVFSPIDVIEEYIRPARYIENGGLVVKEALSDPELVYFEKIGTLEAWNSDGLRSLLRTMKIPNMIEKTLRYPGCIEYLRVLRESGFFSFEEIDVDGKKIRPIDLTSRLLFPKWQLKTGEEDFTVMRVTITGSGKKITYELFDRFDQKTNTISMARTTGYTCTGVANLMLEGNFNRKGICPPEYVGESEENFRFLLTYLKERNVDYRIKESKL
jgi:lysine 6-dehydrogenase